MGKELSPIDLAFTLLGQKRPAPGPSITEHQQRKLGMTQEQLASVGRGTLVAHEPQAGLRAGLFADEPDDAPPIQRDATLVQGLDGESVAAYAAGLAAAERRRTVAKPVVEEKEPPPESEAKRAIRVATENLEKIAQVKADLRAYALRNGIDPDAKPPAKDPAVVEAQALANAERLVVEKALERKAEKRALKARQKILRGIR